MATDQETRNSGDPVAQLDTIFRDAIGAVLGDAGRDADPLVRTGQNPDFGDYQVNGVMGLAKQARTNPRELAGRIVEAASGALDAIAEPAEVAGPGFINIRLKPTALAAMLDGFDTPRLGVTPDADTRPIAIDLCGVNIAKQMHVGHLRSTIIGDTLARVMERCGRTVHRQNHLGDWGLTIAMVLQELRDRDSDLDALSLDDLDAAYRAAQAGIDETDQARQTLIRLQQGDEDLLRDWRKIIDVTMRAVYESFDLLGVRLGPDNNRPESFYRDRLATVVDEFLAAGLAETDQGAIVVRFPDRKRPLIIRKSDGGFLYSTTDLAAVRYRVQELGACRVIYVVDARQRDHFRDVFDAIRLIGWDRLADGDTAQLVHVPFGSVLGADRKPLKTRSGENVPLSTLLTEAIDRATTEVRRRATVPDSPTHDLPDETLAAVGRAIGIGAVKYADLSKNRTSDYHFDWDQMLAFEGNTAPYLQYAYTRVQSVFRRGNIDVESLTGETAPTEPAERTLAVTLLRFQEVLEQVAADAYPHYLCTYLYELASQFMRFYEACPVLTAPEEVRDSRLHLCLRVAETLKNGLGLLGIETVERM